jgi:peptide/nickel transport system permease protein
VASGSAAVEAVTLEGQVARGQPFGRLRWLDRIAIGAFLLVIALAVLAPLVAPYGPEEVAGPALSPPGSEFFLGTDQIGYDIFSRVIFGLRSTLLGAVVVIGSGVIIGGLIGLAAGAMGGWIDSVLMRITDVFLALPAPLLAIAVVAAIGEGFGNTLIAVSVVWWPWYARVVRGEVNALRHRPHAEAARLSGVSRTRFWFRHLLPGAFSEVIILASLDIGILILILAGLTFLGLGAPQPAPELGAMAAQGLRFFLSKWWVAIMPGLAVAFLAFISNLAGDGLRDLLGNRD